MSLVSRRLEENGIPTVLIGSARDIVEQCGVSRFVFSDFPLGSPIGKPKDIAMQKAILEIALELLESAKYSRTTVQAPFVWNPANDVSWRESYMEFDHVEK